MPCLASILIRTFSRPEQLERAVRSVVAQTYRPLELVIVNDGGLDVRQQIEGWLRGADGIRLVYLNTPHQGRAAAANHALSQAKGDYLLFLDDDDWIAPEHLQLLVDAMQDKPELIAAYSDTVCINSSAPDNILKTFEEDFDRSRLIGENFLPIHAVLFRRKALENGCRFDPALNLYEDWHFWIQVVQHGDMYHLKERTAYYCMDESGIGGQQDRDYSREYLAFIRSITPLLTDEQLLHLHFSARALSRANSHITKVQVESDHYRELSRMAEQRAADAESRARQLDTQYQQLESDHYRELSRMAEQRAADAESRARQLDTQYQQLESAHQVLEHKYNRTLINLHAAKYWGSRVLRKAGTVVRLVRNGDTESLRASLRRNMLTLKKLFRSNRATSGHKGSSKPISLASGVDILTTPHTRHVANLIKDCLEQLSAASHTLIGPVRIFTEAPAHFDDRLHVVICPQMFDTLPGQYIAFQMEQTINSRWLSREYIARLHQAYAVLDYSSSNIEYFTQSGELSFEQIFHVPISNRTIEFQPRDSFEYDIAFYGDANSPRRKQFLDELGKHFKLLIVRETFGDALIDQLNRAAIIVNIHYYEGALLETTRLYECLSYGFRVVSESSVDINEHTGLQNWIDFTPIDDIEGMVSAVQLRLADIDKGTPLRLANVPQDFASFGFHFSRMLLAKGLVEPEAIYHFSSPLHRLEMNEHTPRLGLSLPETPKRRKGFQQHFPSTPVFPGIRHSQGWRGAALSYQYLANWALKQQLPYLEILEDDAVLTANDESRWQQARDLFLAQEDYDILCGLIADLSPNAQVLDAFEHEGQKYIVIDRMVSMVCNGYKPNALQLLSDWSYQADDVDNNTIDRYLESQRLKVLVPLPFIASHAPTQQSTLWKFENSTYDAMIQDSEKRLLQLHAAYTSKTEAQ
ncbi:glycosyltransferase [Pseudomonadota bacterium 24LQ007]